MSKYTDTQLKDMATEVLADRKEGGMRSFQLLLQLSMICNLPANDILNRMEYYANMEAV